MPPTVSRCSANTVSEPTGCLFFVISTKGSAGSIGPAARTISGFSTPGLKRTVPSFMWKRRLNDTRSSDASTNSSAAGDTPGIRRDDDLDQPVAQHLGVFHGRERVGAELRRGLLAEHARPLAGEERPGVGVGGRDRDVRGRNAGARRRQRADLARQRTAARPAGRTRPARSARPPAERPAPWPSADRFSPVFRRSVK